MKTRFGFVSNSSSSSFIIAKTSLTPIQIQQILDHSKIGNGMGMDYAEEAWTVEVTDTEVRGWTIMDNFDMKSFLARIGVGVACPLCGCLALVTWDDGHFCSPPWGEEDYTPLDPWGSLESEGKDDSKK